MPKNSTVIYQLSYQLQKVAKIPCYGIERKQVIPCGKMGRLPKEKDSATWDIDIPRTPLQDRRRQTSSLNGGYEPSRRKSQGRQTSQSTSARSPGRPRKVRRPTEPESESEPEPERPPSPGLDALEQFVWQLWAIVAYIVRAPFWL